ncbi:hypothetical protein ACLMJK_002266 [Lecanora helva]
MHPTSPFLAILITIIPIILNTSASPSLLLRVPANIPALPPTTRAILTTKNQTLRAPVTRANTFIFNNIPSISGRNAGAAEGGAVSYLLDIACKDYDFMSYGLDVKGDGKMEVYRVQRGGIEIGGREEVREEGFEVRVLRVREYYEARAGFSPLGLLKNPMILIAVVGLAFVFGMPYLMDSMDPEMRKEFEEQQKKSILSGGANTANPLQNFDMAAWMAGKTAGSSSEQSQAQSSAKESGNTGGGGGKARRRG